MIVERDISEAECSAMGNNFPMCVPAQSDTWYQDSEYKFIWNYNFPYYITQSPLDKNQLDLHLYYRENYAYKQITTWSNLSLLTGSLSVTVNNTWFPSPAQEGANQTWLMFGWFLPSGTNATHELVDPYSMFPRPFNWTVVQFYDPNYANENNATGPGRNVPDDRSSSSGEDSGLPGWAIAVITIACVAFVAAIGALFAVWYMRRRQKQTQRQPMTMTEAAAIAAARQPPPPPGTMKSDGASIYSSTPIVAAAGTTSRDSATTDGSTSTRPRGSPPADTFRNLLFSEWKSRMPASSSETDEDELRRRRLGDALLQRELEEEGAAVKHTDRRPMTVAPPEALESKAVVLERQDGNHPSSSQ